MSCQILLLRTNKALPSLPKNKQQQKEKQKERSWLGAVLFVGDGGGCFQSINQLIIQYLYWGEQKLSSREKNILLKSITTDWSFSICGHESRRVVALVVAMSREESSL